jgi:hypothetical protein
MNIDELTGLSEAELQNRANACLKALETESAQEKEHHAEAQFYLAEIERRRQRADRAEAFWLQGLRPQSAARACGLRPRRAV